MNSLFLLIPLAIVMVVVAAAFLFAAIRGGQFDDLERYQQRMPDDDP